MEDAPVLIDGQWVKGDNVGSFRSTNPASGDQIGSYPISGWGVIDKAFRAGTVAYRELEGLGPEYWAAFLDAYADVIESQADDLVEVAHAETALPKMPRFADIEIPRTVDQLRQAADITRERSWRLPVLSPRHSIASFRAPVPGVAVVFGPNNFPFAFNAVSGGDFAAAIGTGHPVLAKGNPGHPETTRLLAECACHAVEHAGVPAAILQLLYEVEPPDGLALVADSRASVVAFTGSRASGLALKEAADRAGNPGYFEMGSLNPVVILPNAWEEQRGDLTNELAQSVALGGGQFCTKPGVIFVKDDQARAVSGGLATALSCHPGQTLLGAPVEERLKNSVNTLLHGGARVLYQASNRGKGPSYPITVLEADSGTFIHASSELQSEAFGNVTMLVRWKDLADVLCCIEKLEGNLTGTIYVARNGADDDLYDLVGPRLRERVGRLLENKTPTGVEVVSAMNHGGPFPSTGHPGFTSVGMPASFDRFTMLQCFDNVADYRLPPELQEANPLRMQRYVDGRWTADPTTTRTPR